MAGIKIELIATKRATHACDMIRGIETAPWEWQLLDGMISVGGDGLFNEILCGLVIR